MPQAVQRECRAGRRAVGIMDVSTLGKIDAHGPDVAAFLDRFYAGSWNDLKPGRCRLGLMLDENGMVMDDGIGVRLGERHFMLTTTTGGGPGALGSLGAWAPTERAPRSRAPDPGPQPGARLCPGRPPPPPRDCVGKRPRAGADPCGTDRRQRVGLLAEQADLVLPEGGQIVQAAGGRPPVPMLGHVTSSYASATLERSIALALVKSGHTRLGENVFVTLGDGRLAPARIVSPVFYDREGARQNV